MTSASNLHQLNLALTRGAEKETFVFPKGPSGKVKLAPKRSKASTDTKEVYDPPHPFRNVLFNLSQNTKPPSKKAPSAKKAETTKAVPAKKAAAAKTKTPADKSSSKKSAAASKKAPIATKKAATVKKPSTKKTTSAKSDVKKVSLSW
jgi:histone H1/5